MVEILHFVATGITCVAAVYALTVAAKARRAANRAEQLAAQATETAQRAAAAQPRRPATFGGL